MIARFSIICGLTLAGFAVWWFDSTSKPDHVTFLRLDPAFLAKAMSSRMPILIYVASSKDRACQDLNRGPLMDERVMGALDPFARFKLDLTAGNNPSTEQLAAFIELGGAPPTLIFLTADGHEVARLTGTQSADSIVAAATRSRAGPTAVDTKRIEQRIEERTRAVEGRTRAR